MIEALIQRASPDFIQAVQWNADRAAHRSEGEVKYGRRSYTSWMGRKVFHLRCATNLRAFADGLKDATNLSDKDMAMRMERIESTISDLSTTMPEIGFEKVIVETLESRLAGFRVVAGHWHDVYAHDIGRLDLF